MSEIIVICFKKCKVIYANNFLKVGASLSNIKNNNMLRQPLQVYRQIVYSRFCVCLFITTMNKSQHRTCGKFVQKQHKQDQEVNEMTTYFMFADEVNYLFNLVFLQQTTPGLFKKKNKILNRYKYIMPLINYYLFNI